MKNNFSKLKEKEEKSKSDEINLFIDSIGDLLFVIDQNRIITKANKATCDTLKKTPQEIIGRHCYDLIHGTKEPWCNCPATRTFKTKQVVTEEVDDPNLGIPLLITTSPILDNKGEVTQIIHVAKDISKIRLAEIEMYIAANLLEAASDSVLLHDQEGKIVYFNEAAYKTRGYTKEEFKKLRIRDLETPEKQKFFRSQTKELLESGEATFETANLTKDKKEIPVEIHARIIELDNKKMILSVARDITERKRLSYELKLSEERLKLLFENAPDAYYLSDLKGNFLDGNKKAEEMSGYARNELIGNSFLNLNLLPRNQIPKAAKLLSLNAIGKSTGPDEFLLNSKNGNQISVEIRTHPINIQGKRLILGIARDISKRKAAEEKIKELQEKYETIFESSTDALMLLDEKGFFDCNKSTLSLFRVKSISEFSKYHPGDLSPPTQPDGNPSNELATKHIDKAFKTGSDSFFWSHKRSDGSTFPADVLLTRIKLKNCNVLQATVRDVTERKEAEEKLKEDSLRIELMVEKLRVVGSLTRHDVRNKLSTVTGYAYLLKKKHPDQADIVEGLSKIEQSVRESVKIFEFAKLYEQLGAEELTYVDVESKLDEAVALFSGSLPKIINECHGLTLLADSFLRQLFYNFLDNTRKYGKKTTTIKVHYEKTDEDSLKLIYEDDGVGIPIEDKSKLFTEGFSTGGSTGFGLFLTKKMIDVYGWAIQENGELGKGAKFTITIPKRNKKEKENYRIAPGV